jgi:catechol 2,3-dioxygenase-like lactoylglutathione lyase family enzyme
MTLRLQHIDHVAIYVKNFMGSIRWYQETLGIERTYEDARGVQPAVLCASGTSFALFQSDGVTGGDGSWPVLVSEDSAT